MPHIPPTLYVWLLLLLFLILLTLEFTIFPATKLPTIPPKNPSPINIILFILHNSILDKSVDNVFATTPACVIIVSVFNIILLNLQLLIKLALILTNALDLQLPLLNLQLIIVPSFTLINESHL